MNSRASSATAVVSPLEDFRTSRYIKPDVLPEEILGEGDTPLKDPTSRVPATGNVLQGAAYSFDPEPNGPYFSIPLKKTGSRAPPTRRGTTKELIGRYESLSSSHASPGGTTLTKTKTRLSSATTRIEVPQRLDERKGKGRSPIRQSFRNLLSVFNKKGKTTRDRSLYVSDLLTPPEEQETSRYDESEGLIPPPPPPTKSFAAPLPPINTDPGSFLSPAGGFEQPACTTPLPLYTGTLLYLCKPVTPDGLPVWISCNAALHSTHIVLTWFSALGNPSTSLVQLSQCTDVRSLAIGDLDAAEGSMLPEDPDFKEPKVFELLFEGKAREKFAVASVKGRASWVSAIWDAILQTSAQRTPSVRSPPAGPQSAVLIPDPLHPAARNHIETSNQRDAIAGDEEMKLPASPPSRSIEPAKVQLFDPPVPRTTPPPLTPDKSTYSRLPTPGRQSPSVRSLDQMSIVQQRLAQLERTSSMNTPSPSSAKSTRSRQIVFPPVSPVNDIPRQSILLRHGTISSIGQDSIVDSCGSRIQSPLSPESGRLPSIPSGQSLAIEHGSFIARISRLNPPRIPENPDLFSPASQYSDVAKPASPAPVLSVNTDVPGNRPVATTPTRLLAAYRQPAGPLEATNVPLRARTPPLPVASPNIEPTRNPSPATLAVPPVQQQPISPPSPSQPQFTVLPDPEQHVRLSKIRDQISEIQEEMHRLPKTLGAVVADLSPTVLPALPPKDDEAERLLLNIDESVKRIEGQGEVNAQGLAGIHAKVDAIMALRKADVSAPAAPAMPQERVDAIIAKLEELGVQIKNDLPALSQKLEEPAAQRAEQLLHDVPSAEASVSPALPPPAVAPEEMAKFHERLEEILAAVRASQVAPPAGPASGKEEPSVVETADVVVPAALPALEELLALVKAEKEQRETQMAAQADSARYLNELNSWLETFVKHGTSQIEAVAAGVQNLCKELGPIEAVGEDGRLVLQDGCNGSLLSDVRQLLAENKGSDDEVAALRTSIDGLVAAVHESAHAAEARNQFREWFGLQLCPFGDFTEHHDSATDTMVAMVERQRQDQEHMLKTLATELSNDIRGERLRFVEAMKEATTINVQIHVEEFKKELTREVLSMTQEVTRLQRERQALEQQIADLFAFYAKQKQANEVNRRETSLNAAMSLRQFKQGGKKKGRPPPEGGPLPNAAGRRPLPSPGQHGPMPGAM
ncbi:uncharacterized protein PHACADRAFT_29763 [Phanerochaete carnosa HHB-10118-sp]|uniref:PH domain-containing protein n=1 Tax=Phanerochaete carnosa (strain HHB-10118-sp) TaxID=650164 RepID=K5VSS0_PHACS|nr:uncharacterized protein PHACADRAFT_29763 [Phanerochaete carnosa HHB-10118-sp]EKM54558.1 hypothetical protein PHACADRAFT_29763 [Phanerochaete carnosa HHB-10118-sp]